MVNSPPRYDYDAYSGLAGPAAPAPPERGPIGMRRLTGRRPVGNVAITLFAFAFEAGFVTWLLSSITIPDRALHPVLHTATWFMIVATLLIEVFRLINVITLCLATI